MKRLLSLFAMTVLLGAGCSPAPTVETGTTPETPAANQPSVSVPPEDPATKDWLTYSSRQFGFTFKYPKHIIPTDLEPREIPLGTAVENYGSKNVPVRWMQVLLLRSDDPGLKEHYYSANGWTEGEELTDAKTETIGGLTWYILKESDAAAGNRYSTHSYTTTIGYTHVVLLFKVHSVACQNYGEDWQEKCVEFDEARDTELFRKIVETYKPKSE
ncbi:hypothetical protein IT407_02250 [Candidatus Uhrbacteria bacterium]|nr:hypothetical protein [Candidatus Uhrbacteria bacterium]